MNNENLQIIPYQPAYAKKFYDLNVGFIFLAKHNNEIVGVVALINQKTFFELSKMSVLPKYQGLKIGEKLMHFCIEFAKSKDWKSITLYSHRKLVPAINLYKKVGFKEVEIEKEVHYERANIKMLLNLN